MAYRGSHADIVRQARGNVQMRGADAGDFSTADWIAILARYKNTCAYCTVDLRFDVSAKHPRKATIDHIVSLTQGGRHTKDNIVPSCWQCNSRKGSHRIAPLPPPGTPFDGTRAPLPDVVEGGKKSCEPITPAHVECIIELRHYGRSISEIMTATGLTFNQIARQLSILQKAGKVPIIGRGRRKNRS